MRVSQRNQSVLITGGFGFIGLNLANNLAAEGKDVTLYDNLSPQIHGVLPQINSETIFSSKVKIIRADIRNQSELREALYGVDAIVHLAAETGTAQSMYQIAHYNDVNSQATASLLDILANSAHSVKKIVLASSRAIYGEGAYRCADHGSVFPSSRRLKDLQANRWEPRCPFCDKDLVVIPTSETAPASPASIYAATKLAQEDLVRIAGSALNIGTVILRLQNVYGAGQSLNNPYTGILSIFSTRIRRGMSLPIFEDGHESRDFVHVHDVTRVIQLALSSDKADGQTLNVGTGKPTTVLEIANLLVDLLDGKTRPVVSAQYRLGDIRHCYADLTRLSSVLDFSPQIGIEEGLKQFVEWVVTQPLPEDGLDHANDELKKRKMMP